MQFDLGGSGASPLEAEDPRAIGAIPLLGRLGSGGMGRVYLGVVDGKYAAVKQVLPAFAEDSDFLRHFGHELDNLARLPGDVSAALLASDREARPPWFATAYVPGLTLSQATDLHGGPLSVPMLWLLLRETAAELKAVHALDMVHRDLKPSNVMLTEQGVTLIDFGVARAADQSRLTKTGMMLGTPAYMSPEQANGLREFTGATDVWALGALIAYAASGVPPFGEGSGVDLLYRIVHTEPDLERVRALDAGLGEVVAACLDKNPEARPSADRLHQLGRQKCGAPQPGWPQEVMTVLAERASFARVAAPAVTDVPEESPKPEPKAESEPEQISKRPVVLAGAPPAERPRRQSRLLLTALPILLAAGTAFSVILLPKLFPSTPHRAGTPSASSSVTTSGSPGNGPSGSASPSAGTSGTPSASGTPSGGGGTGSHPTSSPGSGANGGATGGSGGSRGSSGGGTSGTSGTAGTAAGTSGGTTSGGTHGATGGSGGSTPPSGSAPGTVTHWSAYFQGFYVGYARVPIQVSWTRVSGATSYDIHYTNDGKGNPQDRTDTVIPAGDASSYTISSQYSGDNICIWLRAVNSYGRSSWSQSICATTPE